jgi:hypothetical protein
MTQTSAADQASASSARKNQNQPSLMQHHIGQLHNLVDTLGDNRHRAMSHTKLEELEAWLTWTGLSGTAAWEEDLKPADEPVETTVLTTDAFIKMLDRSKDYVLDRIPNGQHTLKVHNPQTNEWRLYLSPPHNLMSADEANSFRAFMKTEFGL